ncbi:hypothetical protein ASPVEDRAFT_45890 [Aspergillus versicolor CBS 583.65]|uniref:FAD-binding PCMH-type domain-containing protein n=1 Tax=Aspergillus versicolor CBS 583.65 TaxID=1036611 RepID=A0A1L9PYA4_ASPVE|nr:uncharacterized protein ASPVEDRAFT_45890 [Aspergillus versicolor CBS 583.65]OJJ06521.1 hypothetical protein ASPVEDRAFT_45890 [Aspergillus versicolor CBS 583.65]
MPLDTDLVTLRSLLSSDELISPDSPDYIESSKTWAAQKQCNPRLVVRPTSVESLSKTIAHLYSTNLDFAIYGQGFMSASAKDVLVNISCFDEFLLDKSSMSVTVGAGQTWDQVYQRLEKEAPEYGIVGARTPSVGVGGTILNGGWSWLSGEFGCISDPINFLDAKVVKYDGSVVWASSEPDLMWALRGGGGGVGVLVSAVLRVFPYPQDIWTGAILVPSEHLEQVAEGVSNFASHESDPKVTMFLYVLKEKVLKSIAPEAKSDMMVIHAFDANGEAHGRESFKWALDIPGAIDQTKMSTLAGVADLQKTVSSVKQTMAQYWAPFVLPDITKEVVIKSVKWVEAIKDIDEAVADSTYLIFEVFCTRDPPGPISEVAWPRPAGSKHILLFGPGCPAAEIQEKAALARQLATEIPTAVLGSDEEVYILPNGAEDYHDPRKIWGQHFDKLQTVRKRYDPQCRFRAPVECKD